MFSCAFTHVIQILKCNENISGFNELESVLPAMEATHVQSSMEMNEEQHVKGGDSTPLAYICETPPGRLHPCLGNPA